jgi:hypothetical protein
MRRLTAIVVISCFFVAPAAFAEPPAGPIPGIRASIAHVTFSSTARERSVALGGSMGTNTKGPSSAQRARAAIALGFLGMLGGTWIGAKLTGNCRCQDGGLEGAMIGMPVGAVVGGMVGWHLAR